MKKTFNEEQITRWTHFVVDRSEDIDPDDERDWYDMAVGFFLGAGMTGEDAYEHATEAVLRRGLG